MLDSGTPNARLSAHISGITDVAGGRRRAIKRRTAARQFSSRITASNCLGPSCFDRATVLLRFRQQRSEGGKIVASLLVLGRRLGLVERGENGRPVRRQNGGSPDRAGVADGGTD